jgi:hypothetical protein
LTILILIFWNSASGQSSVFGDWISASIGLTMEIKNETRIQDRYDKVAFSFNTDGSYKKTYFIPRDTKEVPLYRNYEVKDEKLIKKQILTEDGAALKMLIVKEKIETGKFELNPQGDSVIFHDNLGVTTRLKINKNESQLVLIDTVDDRLVYIIFNVDKRKVRRRGSS